MAKFKPPEISWTAQDLHQEWHRFNRQTQCIFEGPLHEKEESVKVSYLKLWVGDKGLDVFEGFTFAKPEDAAKLNVVLKKFEQYCAPRKNHIMAALKFNERRQGDNESFDSFVTDLKIVAIKKKNEWFETRSFFVVNIPKCVRSAWTKLTR